MTPEHCTTFLGQSSCRFGSGRSGGAGGAGVLFPMLALGKPEKCGVYVWVWVKMEDRCGTTDVNV